MITDYYTKVVETQRLTDIVGTEKEEYADYLTEVNCLIQPLSDSYSEDLDGSVGKDYTMFCEVVDIQEGDKVIDGTDEYRVVGVKRYSDKSAEHHLEITIRMYKQ